MVDTTNKNNRKCEHCEFWGRATDTAGHITCSKTGVVKNYWNCCRQFQWKPEYLTPEAQSALEQRRLDREVSQLTKIDRQIADLKKELEKQQKLRDEQYIKVVAAKREFLGTQNLRPGDELYYIDYENSGSRYCIVAEINVSEDEVLTDGRYFVLSPINAPVTKSRGFVRVESVNADRFFTTPERAHEAFVLWNIHHPKK